MLVYVVVTEEYYGGEFYLKVFSDRQSAEEYADVLGSEKDLDIIIMERTIETPL